MNIGNEILTKIQKENADKKCMFHNMGFKRALANSDERCKGEDQIGIPMVAYQMFIDLVLH